MTKFLRNFLHIFVLVICVAELTLALDCLFCKSPDLYSECRLGQRRNKPKLSKCTGPEARCYAKAQIHENGTATFKRGCTLHSDFCDTDLEYCETCGSSYCNYWYMEVSEEVKEYLNQEEPEEPKSTSKPHFTYRQPTSPRVATTPA